MRRCLPISPSARIRCLTHSLEHSPIKPGRQAGRTRSQASFTRRSGVLRSMTRAMIGAMIGGRVDSSLLKRAVANALGPSGLAPRGWLVPEESSTPLLKSGAPAKSICLVGHGGGDFWPVFQDWQEMHPGIADPLDTWSKAVISPAAASLGGEAVFPSDRPWQPFQQWSMAAEGLKPSPLGLLIHPEYGLWHGYRGAILFADTQIDAVARPPAATPSSSLAEPEAGKIGVHPCDTCGDKPCLSSCPVAAFKPAGFAVSECRSYLETRAGQDGCMRRGCLARDACPVGRDYRYGSDQIRFHMAHFS